MTVIDLKVFCEAAIEEGLGENEIIMGTNNGTYQSPTIGFSSPNDNWSGLQKYMEINHFNPDSTLVLN